MSEEFMKQVVNYLTNYPPFYRYPGTEGHEKSKNYIIEKLKELKMLPGNNGNWLQPILDDDMIIGENIIGVLPGMSDKYILLIAHYDTIKSCHEYTPGANDNAAAIAVVMETIKNIEKWHGESNIMVLICDLEEPPYFHTSEMGSTYFYDHCPIDNSKITCAVVLDLVGHDIPFDPLSDALFITGAENYYNLLRSTELASKNSEGVSVYPIRNDVVGNMSDHHIFQQNNRPFLFLSCGRNEHYHQSSDTIDTLNFNKMENISKFMKELIFHLDSEKSNLIDDHNSTPNKVSKVDNVVAKNRVMALEARLYSTLLNKDIKPVESQLNAAAFKIMSYIESF